MKLRKGWMLCVILIMGLMAATVAVAAEQSITGTVEQTADGIVIKADTGDSYKVSGSDLTAMVGKTVKATGTLAETDTGKTLTITNVEEVKK